MGDGGCTTCEHRIGTVFHHEDNVGRGFPRPTHRGRRAAPVWRRHARTAAPPTPFRRRDGTKLVRERDCPLPLRQPLAALRTSRVGGACAAEVYTERPRGGGRERAATRHLLPAVPVLTLLGRTTLAGGSGVRTAPWARNTRPRWLAPLGLPVMSFGPVAHPRATTPTRTSSSHGVTRSKAPAGMRAYTPSLRSCSRAHGLGPF